VRLGRYLRLGEVLAGGGDVQGGEVAAAESHRGWLVDREADDRVEVAGGGIAADLPRGEDGEPQAAVGVEGQAVRNAVVDGDEAAALAEFARRGVAGEDVDAAAEAVGVEEAPAVVGPVKPVGQADPAEQFRHLPVRGELVQGAGRPALPPGHCPGPEVAPWRRLAVVEPDHGGIDRESLDAGERVVTGGTGLAGPEREPVRQREDQAASGGQPDGADRDRARARDGRPVGPGGREPGVRAGSRVEAVDVPRVDVHPAK